MTQVLSWVMVDYQKFSSREDIMQAGKYSRGIQVRNPSSRTSSFMILTEASTLEKHLQQWVMGSGNIDQETSASFAHSGKISQTMGRE